MQHMVLSLSMRVPGDLSVHSLSENFINFCTESCTVKPVLNGMSRDQNIFPLKPGFRLIKVHYLYKN